MAQGRDSGAASSQDEALAHTPASRLGLTLFGIYVLLYAGFMLLTVFKPQLLGATFAGVNVAILYGMGLILAAIVLAVIYTLVGRNRHD